MKEKLLAAHRGGITTVLIPADNAKDLVEIPDNIKQNLLIKPVHWIDEVLEVALQYMPVPIIDKDLEIIDAENKRKAKSRELTAH